jgi:PPK2 family polyphosphate:nucleotide phosphotransferase
MAYRDTLLVEPGRHLALKEIDPSFTDGHESEKSTKVALDQAREQLARMQPLLWAEKKHSLLVVLQGLDAAGKDGTIGRVLSGVNPQGVRVTAFREPTPDEAAHDFLWRIHPHAPARGDIAVFNRSHYEDVLVPRVHKLIDKAAWEARYRHIRAFEEGLAENGTRILKFLLHISKDEQLRRFADRLDDPSRNWKISEADYAERPHWDSYIAAYEDAIAATSTKSAPWFVIPADHKWFRNLAVSQIIVDALAALDMAYPKPRLDLADIRRRYHAEEREAKNDQRRKK